MEKLSARLQVLLKKLDENHVKVSDVKAIQEENLIFPFKLPKFMTIVLLLSIIVTYHALDYLMDSEVCLSITTICHIF